MNAPGVIGYEVIRNGQQVSTTQLQSNDIVTKTIMNTPNQTNSNQTTQNNSNILTNRNNRGGNYPVFYDHLDSINKDSTSPTGYSDSKGQPVSVPPQLANNVKTEVNNNVVVNNTSPTGYSDTLNQPVSVSPQAAQQIQENQARQKALQQDLPKTVVSSYQPPSLAERLKSIPSYVAANIRQDVVGTIKGVEQKIVGDKKTIGMIKERKELKNSQEIINTGTADIKVNKNLKPYQNRGTISTDFATFNARPLNEQELLAKAAMGEISPKSAVQEVSNRVTQSAQKQIDKEFNANIQPQINVIQSEAEVEAEQAKIDISQRSDLTNQQQNELLQQKVDEINKKANEKANKLVTDFNSNRGKQIQDEAEKRVNNFNEKLTITRNIKLGAEAVAVGAVAAPVLGAVLPTSGVAGSAVKIGSKALEVGVIGYTGINIGTNVYSNIKSGNITPLSIGASISEAAPLVGFYAGAKVSNRLLNPKVDANELKTALETAKIKQIKTEGITKEANLGKLELTNEGKIEVTNQLNQGLTVRKTQYTLYNENNYLNKILTKGLPTKDIEFIESIDTKGNIINSVATGRIKLGGGRYLYKEDILRQSSGIRDESGIKMETTTISNSNNKIKEIRTSELIRPKVDYYQDELGNIKRIITSNTATFPEDVNYPQSISKTAELQELKSIDRTAININVDKGNIKESTNLIEQDLTFKTIDSAGYSKRTLKPIEFSKIRETKSVFHGTTESNAKKIIEEGLKPQGKENAVYTIEDKEYAKGFAGTKIAKEGFKEKPVTIEFEIPKSDFNERLVKRNQGKGGADEITFSKLEPQYIKADIEEPKPTPSTDFSKTIKDTLSNPEIAELEVGKYKGTGFYEKSWNSEEQFNIAMNNLKKNTKEIKIPPSNIEISSNSNINDVTNKFIQSSVTTPKIDQSIKQIEIPKYNQNINLDLPNFNPNPDINKVPGFGLPPIGFGGLPSGFKQQNYPRRINIKNNPKYTASLAAAAFQAKPIKVTKEQYEQLNQQTYSGLETRPVLEIVPDKEIIKKLKKLKF